MHKYFQKVTHMPTPLPDEHILSVLLRRSLLSDRNEFSASVADITHDTSGLTLQTAWRQVYADITEQLSMSCAREEILRNHSLMPYYTPFHLRQVTHIADPKEQSQIVIRPSFQNIIKATTLWRWCPVCIEKDLALYGTTHWHVSHQIPTVTRCLEHHISLVGICPSCGFQQKNISRGLPPEDKKCRQCNYTHQPKIQESSELHLWLEQISTSFLRYRGSMTIHTVRELLRDEIGFGDFSSNRSVTNRKKLLSLQSAFITWLEDDTLSSFFIKQSKAKLATQPHTAFRLSSAAYKNVNLPPICYLLMLRFLGICNYIQFRDQGIQGEPH